MAKYLQVAAQTQGTIDSLMALIPDEHKKEAAVYIAHIYNYGIRTAPRGVQSTVRLNAVTKACEKLPVVITMEKVENDNGYSFNALRVK